MQVVEEEVEADREVQGDLRKSRVLVEIANSIFDYLQFTADCPSLHTSLWMPLLDLEVRVAPDQTIDYQFYSEPCSSKFVMMRSSAMPASVKMASLIQDVVRRLRNTRATLPWLEHHAKILTTFCRKMARSGYRKLARKIGEVLEEEGRSIKMELRCVETGGVSLAGQLVRPDLKAGEPCGRPGCVLDRTSGGAGGPHNVPSVLYRGTCNLCGAIIEDTEYWGESGRSGFHRCKLHDKEVQQRKESNAFAKHLALFHPESQGDITNFNIQVVSTFKKPLSRKKTEAVKIASSKADHLMNSKAEHRQPALHRVQMVRNLEELQPPGGRGGGRGRGRRRGGV